MRSQWQFCTGKVLWIIHANVAILTTVGAKAAQTSMPTSTDPSFTSTLCHYCMAASSWCGLVYFWKVGELPTSFILLSCPGTKKGGGGKSCFLYVCFDVIFVWARGIYKHSLHAAFSAGATQLYSCITSPLQWPGHILFLLRVASLSSLSNCSKYNSWISCADSASDLG